METSKAYPMIRGTTGLIAHLGYRTARTWR